MTSQGNPWSRFQRALTTGNLTLVRAAAAELPRSQRVNTRAASCNPARSHTAASAAHAAGRRVGSASNAAAA
jgi:hypothetical protein